MRGNYWQQAYAIGRSVYRARQLANVDEQAGPAYFDAFALSRWLFWQRLKWAARQIDRYPGQHALDFGCGFGLLLPKLRERFASTVAVDLVPQLAQEFMRRWDKEQTPSGQVSFAHSLDQAELQPGSLDLIVALDVLEHFQSLPEIVTRLARLLKPNGRMLVSGPTESWLYRLGRRIVGFSGDYHHQTIFDVHHQLEQSLELVSVRSLPAITPLFLMSTWKLAG